MSAPGGSPAPGGPPAAGVAARPAHAYTLLGPDGQPYPSRALPARRGESVTDTALACGWANPTSSIEAFAALVGETPGRYRKRQLPTEGGWLEAVCPTGH